MYRFFPIYVLLTFLCVSETARILGVFPWPAYSHYAAPSALLRELAQRGHQVTVFTSYPQKPPVKNLRDIDLSESFKYMRNEDLNLYDFEGINVILGDMFLNYMMINTTEHVLANAQVQDLLKSNEEFDLVLIEDFLPHALKGIAYRYKAPCIMINSIGVTRLVNSQVGNPYFPAYMPDVSIPSAGQMDFFQRLENSVIYLYYQLFNQLYVLPRHNQMLQKYFPGSPSINELYYNVSLLFVNGHFSVQQPIPFVPNVIDIAGIHVKAPKPLPADLQQYFDSSPDGFIFFSMGSNLKSTHLPKEKLQAILNAFGKLKQRVVFKWESDDLPGKPSNVKIGKWLPQSDILAHPKIKLFITHGGLQSQIEAVYWGVPILGIPIYGDQKSNMAIAESNGNGLRVPYRQLTEEFFLSKLQEVLTNPKYKEAAKMRSKIMHDQPTTPSDRAVFWVEYVLRHKGAPHLRTAALNLMWYQYLLLDIILFLLAIALIPAYCIYFIVKKLRVSRKCASKTRKSKND